MDGSIYGQFFDGLGKFVKALVTTVIVLFVVAVGLGIWGFSRNSDNVENDAIAKAADLGVQSQEAVCSPWSRGTIACRVVNPRGPDVNLTCTKRSTAKGYRCVEGIDPLVSP